MSAANVPLVIDQGEDYTAQIVWTNSFDEPQNVIAPCRMEIKDKSGAIALTLETPEIELPPGEIPQIQVSETSGMVQIHMTKSVTAALPAGEYAYDLFVTVNDGDEYAGNQTHRLIFGQVTVNKRITVM